MSLHRTFRWRQNLLNKTLKEIQVSNNPKYLYRGAKFSEDEIEVLYNHIGKSFLMRGFNSTSDLINVPLNRISKHNNNNPKLKCILFIISIKDSDLIWIKSIGHLSFHPEENEWLLNNTTFIKINNIHLSEHY